MWRRPASWGSCTERHERRSLGTETSLCQGGTEHQAVIFRRIDAAQVIVDRRVMLGAPVVQEDDIAGPPSMETGKGRLAGMGTDEDEQWLVLLDSQAIEMIEQLDRTK